MCHYTPPSQPCPRTLEFAALPGLDPRADAALVQRWPHLRRPGPQPCNQIPPDYATALRRLALPRRPEPTPMAMILRAGRVVRRFVRAEVSEAVRAFGGGR
jgi:hypothetical protein